MWILIRLILAGVGFVIRQLSRGRVRGEQGWFDGLEYFERTHQLKNRIRGFTLAAKRKSPSWIRFHAESNADRWFKRLGIANEVQTGDAAFDDRVYVTCDHPFVAQLLKDAPDLRAAILDLVTSGATRIVFDGTMVSVYRQGDFTATDRDRARLKALWEASWKLEDELPSRFADPFLWKALVVEGVVWSIAGYAIGAGIEMIVHGEDYHVSTSAVWKKGLLVAVVAFVVLVGVIAVWLRGSSRGHRVIIESAIVLLVGLLPASAQAVADTNRAFDSAPAQTLTRTIERCETRERRRRGFRRRTTRSYHLWISPEPGPALPPNIEITRELCNVAQQGDLVEIQLKPGRWGISWYQRIAIGETSWTTPL